MKKLLLILLAVPAFAQTCAITSPASNAIVTTITMPITISLTSLPSIASVEYSADGRILDNGIVRSAPWGMVYNAYFQGDVIMSLSAAVKDVFGTVLATCPAITVTIKLMGATAVFQSLPNPVTGTAAILQYRINHPYTNPDGNASNLSIDGVQAIGWNGGNSGRLAGPPPYGEFVTLDSTKWLNGNHELFAYTAYNGIIGSNHINTGTFTFASTAVSTGSDTITFNDHTLADPQNSGFTLTTTGTLPAPLALATTYFPIYVDANTFQVAATKGGSPIDLTTQGTGNHTVHYQIDGTIGTWSGWCDLDAASSPCPANVSGSFPLGYDRAMVTFSNGAAPMEIRPPTNYCFLTPGGTCNIAPTLYNTDYSTTAITATTPTYTANVEDVAGCITVNASGVVAAANPIPNSQTNCSANVTEACTGAPCNAGISNVTVLVKVSAVNNMPHFDHGGQVRTTYSPGNSFIPRGMGFFGQQIVQNTAWGGPEMVNAGINVVRESPGIGSHTLPGSATCSGANSVTSDFNTYYAAMKPLAQQYKFYFWFQLYEWPWAPWSLQKIMSGLGFDRATCGKNIIQTLANDGLTTIIEMQDEVDGEFGHDPFPNHHMGGPQVTSITVASNVATFAGHLNETLHVWSQSTAGNDQNQNVDNTWIRIINSATTGLNGVYKITGVTTDSSAQTTAFTFATVGVSNGTYNVGNDPNLEIVAWPFSANFRANATCYIVGTENTQPSPPQYTWAGNHHFGATLTSDGTTLTIPWTSHGLSEGDVIRVWAASSTNNLNQIAAAHVIDANNISIPTLAAAASYTVSTDPALYITKDCMFDNNVLVNFRANVLGEGSIANKPADMWPIIGNAYTGNLALNWQITNWNKNSTYLVHPFMYFPGQVPTGPFPAYGHAETPYQIRTDHTNGLETQRSATGEPFVCITYALNGDYLKGKVDSFQFTPSQDRPYALYGDTAMVAAKLWQPLAMGCTGFRLYNYHDNPNDFYTPGLHARIGNQGVRHYITSEQYITVALGYNMIKRFEKYLLQPRFNSPYYGKLFYTAARGDGGATYGNILLIGSYSEMPYPSTGTMTIDLTPCRISGGKINRYRITPRLVRASILGGNPTTDTVKFNDAGEAGEVIAYTCQPSSAVSDLDSVMFVPPATLPTGTTKYAVKVGYYPASVEEGIATDCTAGCSLQIDHSVGPAWVRRFYLGSDNSIKYRSDVEAVPAQNP